MEPDQQIVRELGAKIEAIPDAKMRIALHRYRDAAVEFFRHAAAIKSAESGAMQPYLEVMRAAEPSAAKLAVANIKLLYSLAKGALGFSTQQELEAAGSIARTIDVEIEQPAMHGIRLQVSNALRIHGLSQVMRNAYIPEFIGVPIARWWTTRVWPSKAQDGLVVA